MDGSLYTTSGLCKMPCQTKWPAQDSRGAAKSMKSTRARRAVAAVDAVLKPWRKENLLQGGARASSARRCKPKTSCADRRQARSIDGRACRARQSSSQRERRQGCASDEQSSSASSNTRLECKLSSLQPRQSKQRRKRNVLRPLPESASGALRYLGAAERSPRRGQKQAARRRLPRAARQKLNHKHDSWTHKKQRKLDSVLHESKHNYSRRVLMRNSQKTRAKRPLQ
mmetsp:Transcript_6212/g.20144  ORF Transcript_6212/g.20144 Transcript_6212/m.20144 type:complete len:227 (-) Transcript_6212:1969-2649(-)